MDDLLQEPEAMDFQMAPLQPEFVPPPQARPVPPQMNNMDEFLQANPNLPRIMRPDGSVIQDSYRGIPGAPMPPQQQGPPDPMQALYQLARSGNQRAQTAFIHALQVNSELSHRERLQMQRMEAAVGQVTNNPNYTFEEKSNAIMQLRTGIDFYRQRDQRANQKAMMEKRQQEADALKQQSALVTGMATMNDAQFAEWTAKNTRVLPSGHLLSVLNGKLQVTAPIKEDNTFDKDYDHAVKALTTKDELTKVETAPTQEQIEKYIADKNALKQKMTGKAPQGGAANPAQQEYDKIKAQFPGGSNTITDPAIRKRVLELRAAGAK